MCSGDALVDGVVPPQVAALGPRRVDPGAAHHENVLYGLLPVDRLIDGLLERRRFPAPVLAVGGDHQLGLGILDAGRERRRREPGEDDGVQHAEACAGQHRHDGLGQHRHVDRDPIAGHQAEVGQRVGRLGHLRKQLGVGDLTAVVLGLALPADRHPVPVARLDVSVDAVVGDVELAADEPLRDGGFRPVEDLVERGVPGQSVGLFRPECQAVFFGLGGQLGGRVGLRCEVVGWWIR